MQIAAFNELRAEFIKAGVGVHHITAEGGGSEAVLKRLAERGLRPGCTRRVTQPLHSDPEWKLMVVEPKDEVYIGSPIAPALLEKGYEMYTRVEPALVVLDQAANVLYRWSWHSLEPGKLSEGEGAAYTAKFGETQPNARTDENPTGNSHDVRWRPVAADLLARLQRGGDDLDELQVASVGFPAGENFEFHTTSVWQ